MSGLLATSLLSTLYGGVVWCFCVNIKGILKVIGFAALLVSFSSSLHLSSSLLLSSSIPIQILSIHSNLGYDFFVNIWGILYLNQGSTSWEGGVVSDVLWIIVGGGGVLDILNCDMI